MRDPELELADSLGQVLGAEHAGRTVGAAAGPLDHGVQVDRRAWDPRRRGDQPGLKLPRAPALADDQVAKHARADAAIVGGRARRRAPSRGPRCGRRCSPPMRAGSPRRRRRPPSCPAGDSRAPAARRQWRRTSTRACCGSARAPVPARSARARSRRAGRSCAERPRPGPACGRVGARMPFPAMARRGRVRRHGCTGRRSARRPGAASRPSAPPRTGAWTWSAGRGRDRPGARRRRRRRSRSRARPRARPGRANRSRARARRPGAGARRRRGRPCSRPYRCSEERRLTGFASGGGSEATSPAAGRSRRGFPCAPCRRSPGCVLGAARRDRGRAAVS